MIYRFNTHIIHKNMENNVSYTIPLDASNLGIPTLDRCIKLLPFNIETNFYYLPDGGLYFNTKKDFKNKSTTIPAPQVHELRACIKKSIMQIFQNVSDFYLVEILDEIDLDIYKTECSPPINILVKFSDNLANDYADFLIKLYDVMIDNEFADIRRK